MSGSQSFHLRYALTRRDRLAVELYQWLPAIAGTIGFLIGALYLILFVSAWFLWLVLLPVVAYRGLFAFLFDISFRARQPVEVIVEDERLEILIDGNRCVLALVGIFQVFRSEGSATWTVLHMDGTVLTIPAAAIAVQELDYLKSFALRAARDRKAAELPA